jgi:hypothetical protein
MIAGLLKFVLDVLKLAPRYLVALAIPCAVLLFSSGEFLGRLGLAQFAQDNRQWLGLGFLVCASILGVWLAAGAMSFLGGIRKKQRARKRMLQTLHSLTEEEKKILRFYVVEQTRSNVLRLDDGSVQRLVAAGIIYRSAPLGNLFDGFAHNIANAAWEYLHKDENMRLLSGSTEDVRTDSRRILF